MKEHLDKPAVKAMFTEFSVYFSGMSIETISVHGAHDFCVWESRTMFTLQADIPGVPFKKGEEATLLCSSLMWWNMEKKIVKEVDYAVWKK